MFLNKPDNVAVVLKPHTARDDDELDLKVKEVVTVTERGASGWWKGELNGKAGLFPMQCVQLLPIERQAVSITPHNATWRVCFRTVNKTCLIKI